MKLLSISTDRKIFEEGSAVRARQVEYAKNYEEMHIVVFTGPNFAETSFASNVFVYPTRSRSKFLYPFDAIKLGKFIAARRGITHITCQDSSLTAMVGVALKKKFKLPLEIQVHTDIGSPNFTFTIGNRIRKAMSLSYLKQADKVRVVSERIKRYLVETLNIAESKIEVRPIAVPIEAIIKALITVDLHKKYPQFDKIVLMASRHTKEKNIQLALDAWPRVIERAPKTGLVIVGDGPLMEKLKGQAGALRDFSNVTRKLSLSESIIFEPWADQQTLYSYYKTADLFLNISLFEGYGMTLVEAQAAGCKIVSTDVGVAREIGAEIVEWNAQSVANAILK